MNFLQQNVKDSRMLNMKLLHIEQDTKQYIQSYQVRDHRVATNNVSTTAFLEVLSDLFGYW